MKTDKYDFHNEIQKQIQNSIATKREISTKYIDVINDIAGEIIKAYKKGKKVLWFGNGGSAADAQHLACELVSRFYIERPAIPSLALTTNTSILTAVANDYQYEDVFARQVEAIAHSGDILIGITTSGKSPNVIKALHVGKRKGAVTVALTGKYIKKIKNVADYIVSVPSEDTPHIQESHIMIGHILCFLVEKTLFTAKKKK